MKYDAEKERLESKIILRFRAEETGCIVVFEGIVSVFNSIDPFEPSVPKTGTLK